MMLPLGGYHKYEIRSLAHELGLRVADKRDSQEICFVTSGHHGDFVRQRRGDNDTSGEFVTTAGTVVGPTFATTGAGGGLTLIVSVRVVAVVLHGPVTWKVTVCDGV